MSDFASSLLRITATNASAATWRILDWGDTVIHPAVPWSQNVIMDELGGDWAKFGPGGDAKRTLRFTRRSFQTTPWSLASQCVSGISFDTFKGMLSLDVRVLNCSVAESSSESARTYARWTFAEALIVNITPAPQLDILALDFQWEIQVGAVASATP